MIATISLLTPNNERQLSVNIFGLCIMGNQMAVQRSHPIINVMAAFMGIHTIDDIATTSQKLVSMVH
jgi:hypothetical protein